MTTSPSDISMLLLLLEAARMGEFARIRSILDQGVSADLAGPAGQTSLMVAAHHGLPETLELLLERGANASRQDEQGNTALHWAVEMNDEQPDVKCLALLVSAGCNLEARNHKGQTPLLYCAQAAVDYLEHYGKAVDYAPCLLFLIGAGADLGAVDNNHTSTRDILENNPQAFIANEVAPVFALMDRITLQRGTQPSSCEARARRI